MDSIQKERISRRKHHWGRLGDVPERYLPQLPLLREPIDLVVECDSSDTEIQNRDAYHDELRESLTLKHDAEMVLVSHHLAHLYGAFFPSPFDLAAGLIVDAQGSPSRGVHRARDTSGGCPRSDGGQLVLFL